MLPELQSVVYWDRISAFQKSEDLYDTWVMFAVSEGRFWYRIKDQEGEAGFGDLVVCPPLAVFARKVTAPLSFYFFRFHWKDKAEHDQWVGKIAIADRNRLASNYSYLGAIMKRFGEAMPAMAGHILRDLWTMRLMEMNETPRTFPATLMERVRKAEQLIRKLAFGPVSMKEIAVEAGLTPVQLTRRFRDVYGQTPIQFLTSLRIQKAQTLLLETDWTLDRIAEQCGYDNGFYLSRVFSKRLQVSPAEYRRMNRI